MTHKSFTPYLLSGLAALAMLTTEGTARADRFDLSVGTTIRYARSASVDALAADDAHPFFSLVGSIRLDRPLVPGFDMFVEGAFETGGIEGQSLRRIDTSTSITSGTLGGKIQRRLPGKLTGFARLGVGVSRLSTTLTDQLADAASLSDRAYLPTGYASTGLELMAIRNRNADGVVKFALGLRLEVGYVASTSAKMEATPDHDGEDDVLRIPTASASLGSLNVSGRTYRVGLVGRF